MAAFPVPAAPSLRRPLDEAILIEAVQIEAVDILHASLRARNKAIRTTNNRTQAAPLNAYLLAISVVHAGPTVGETPSILVLNMSWAGFKKNVNRATTQVMMKTGHVERTNDRDYEVEERRYRTMEAAANRLQKEAKGYLDSLRAMTASQMRIAETIDAFYGDAGTRDGVSRSYKQAVEDLDAETIKALDGPYRTTVLEPITRFCAYFPDINECIKKRNNKLLDYDSMRSKVKKLVEKPDKDVTKLPRAEREAEVAKQAYEQLNEQLFTELPQLIDLRVPYLDPSFEALVKIQLRFCAEAYSRMAQVQQYLDVDTRDQYARGDLDNRKTTTPLV
ncbi:hypothetical protein DV736_g2016, partial [Chaetothyriales sp. CBS 134916]